MKMAGLAATLLILGVVSYTQAQLLQVEDKVNVTGNGAFCVDTMGMPQIVIDKDLDLAGQGCRDGFKLAGTIMSEIDAGTGSSVTFSAEFTRNCKKRTDSLTLSMEKTIPFGTEYKGFDLNDKLADLDGQLQSNFDACDEPGVCLNLYVKRAGTTGTYWEAIANQEFVLKHCAEDAQRPEVMVYPDWLITAGQTVQAQPNTNGGATIAMDSIFSKIGVKPTVAGLPGIPSGGLRWPRGVLVFFVREWRHFEECNYDLANIIAYDEFMYFYPVNDAIAENTLVEISTAGGVLTMGKGPDDSCPFCGEGTIVVLWDWLGTGPHRTDCDGMSAMKVNINCDAIPPPALDWTKDEIIPFFKDQGFTGWVRKCYGRHGAKIVKMEEDFDDNHMWRFPNLDEESVVENRGVARIMVLARIFRNDLSTCEALAASDDHMMNEVKGLAASLSDDCRNYIAAQIVLDEHTKDADFRDQIKLKCGGHPFLMRAFFPFRGLASIYKAMMSGKCPEGGFDFWDIDPSKADFGVYDRSNMAWSRTSGHGWMDEAKFCDDNVEPMGQCAYRLLAMLFDSPKRFLANKDLYEREMAKPRPSFDEMKPHIQQYVTMGMDPEFARNCPRRDFLRPSRSAPAVWKMGDETDPFIYRGYYHLIKQKWCYRPMARKTCPLCPHPDKDGESGSGSGSDPAATAP